MRYLKLLTVLFVFTFSAAIMLYGQETKQETTLPADTSKAPEGTQGGHDHGDSKDKRYVAAVDPDGVQRIEVTGGEYYFDPKHIVVKVNIPVELTVRKTGFVPHDIVIKAPEAGINVDLSLDKKPKTVKFTPTAPGKYDMSCSKKLIFAKSHKDKGMHGILEVVP